jgi:hypothetical protein
MMGQFQAAGYELRVKSQKQHPASQPAGAFETKWRGDFKLRNNTRFKVSLTSSFHGTFAKHCGVLNEGAVNPSMGAYLKRPVSDTFI